MGRASTLLIAVALSTVGCGGLTDPVGPDETIPDPDGALFRIESEGGFAPMEWLLRRGPVYTLTQDGELISEGVVPAIFPGPLMPFYLVTQVTDGEMGQIRDMIERMGLADMVNEHDDSNANFVTDASTEVITYEDANGTHRYSVYALGIDGGPETSQATRIFAELRTVLDNIAVSRESTPYQGDTIRVIAGEGLVNADFTDLRQWPLPSADFSDWEDVDEFWVCKVFDSNVLEGFGDATEATTWETPTPDEGPAEIQLLVRQLHPGEAGCPTAIPLGG